MPTNSVNNKQIKLTIGLTGGIGSGKTAASDLFAKKGIEVIDTDVLARKALDLNSPLLIKVFNHFGEQLKLIDGSLNRAALRSLIFNDPKAKTWLEALVHPWVKEQTTQALAKATGAYVLLSSPLLIESGQAKLVDRLLVVDIPENLQLERTTKRDSNEPDLVKKIMSQQLARQERLLQADDLIDNSGDLKHLQNQVDSLHNQYLKLALIKGQPE